MKLRKNNKGFTIVELVIVIAVIGILSAVLVPTFVALSSKASDAADESLVANLNKALKIDESAGKEKPQTMYEMLENIDDQGYKLNHLIAKGNHDLLYNLNENKFYLSSEQKVVDDITKLNYWKVYEDVPELSNQTYSIYLNNSSLIGEKTVKVGFDQGSNTTLSKVIYENADTELDVVIRTNGCDLTIDAPLGSVHRYGTCNNILINNISDSSFYDFGKSEYISIHNGRIVVQNSMSTKDIHVNTNNVIIAQASSAVIPHVSRDASVSSLIIQTTTEAGEMQKQSTLTIDGSTVTSSGNVDSAIIDSVTPDVTSSVGEEEAYFNTKYQARLGDYVPGDESNYFASIYDAVEEYKTATAAINIHLVRDITIDNPIIITGASKYTHTLSLDGNSIRGYDCTPLSIEGLKTSFIVAGSNGHLIGDENNPCFKNSVNYQVTITSVNTIGSFYNGASSQYVVINNGTHRLCGFNESGHFRLDTPNSEATYDMDITSMCNFYRNNVVNNNDGTWTLSRIKTETQTANGWDKISNGSLSAEKYDSIENFVNYADYASFSIKLLKAYSLNVNVNTKKTITIDANKKTFTGKIITGGALSLTSAASSGKFKISEISCTNLTVSKYVAVTIDDGTVSGTMTLSGSSSSLTINNGTFKGATTLSGSKFTLTINDGKFTSTATKAMSITTNKNVTLNVNGGVISAKIYRSSTTDTAYTINVTGGTFSSLNVYKTYKNFIADNCETIQSGSAYIVQKVQS